MDIATHPHAQRYRAWFKHLDDDGDGKLGSAQAKEILPRSRLPQHKLASVWQLADSSRNGYLELDSFIKACELMSLAQSGSEISDKAWLTQLKGGIEPPRMDGLDAEAGFDTTAQENPFGSATSPDARGFGSKLTFKRRSINDVSSLIEGLKAIYLNRIKPIEDTYHFPRFHSPCLGPADFAAKPNVLLLGQYSTGKTTFVKTLLGREYPGCNIGPEPTTDRFTVVMHGYEDRQIPGNTLTVSPELPYQSLHHFGTGLLSRLEGSQCNASLLHSVSLVDSPGVLSGEKQRIERGYNFVKVCQWFATRSDIILLLFDPHKLDISDEFKAVIASMGGNEEKLRVCLNKADTIDQQQLLRVYGALMWSLGKVVRSPEVTRVYVGSFNGGKPVRTDVNPNCKELFEAEQTDLMEELKLLPGKSCDRKVNEVVKRIRALKVHLLLLQHLKKQMPALLKKQKKQAKIIENMPDHFRTVQQQNHLATADFPNVDAFADILESFGFDKIPKVQDKHVQRVDEALSVEIPKLVRQFSDPYNDTK